VSDSATIEHAVQILREGGLVAMPTETVYGLAANAEDELAVRRIYAVKGRPVSHPLIVHLARIDQLTEWATRIPTSAWNLAEAFWPGPMTLVLKKSAKASDVVTGGQDTIALRIPAHPIAQALLDAFGGGLAAPSANRFGKVSPTTAEHVRADLGADVPLVLDGGPCEVGVESTIVNLAAERPTLLRPGGLAREDIERVLGAPLARVSNSAEVRAPGLLPTHYAPRAGVVVSPRTQVLDRARELVALGRQVAVLVDDPALTPEGARFVAVPNDPAELAPRLYALMREVDASGVDVMVIPQPAERGLGLALRDRLQRAAAPRG
jgi:L-threonylcarbamoyladenylate synthase